ncbi:hypothetical protein [Azospirillum argentinense]|uniref:Uncharacterized protein n=1 Tax=Azospirillum argentinense TaxID=2970906 RepID=A0A5B0KKL5_9PROT|nr:hypothetical protein [Azospirillum argentinense]KAA1052416.1 hypothetical protein FH063_004747 [Azospirillum argentinense]
MPIMWKRFEGTTRTPGHPQPWTVKVEFDDGTFSATNPGGGHVTGHCEAISADGKLVVHLFNATDGAFPALWWLTLGADSRVEGDSLAPGANVVQKVEGSLID